MVERSHARRKRQSHGDSQTYAPSNTGQSQGSSTSRSYDSYAPPSHQPAPAPSSTQYNHSANYTSSDTYTWRGESSTNNRYHQVPRLWNSARPERDYAFNAPALAYSPYHNSNPTHNYGYDSHTAQTHHSDRPDQQFSPHPRNRQLTTENLADHAQQTHQARAVPAWALQAQQEEPWNGVGSVRKKSEFDPYHTKL